jgi:uncharacterized protein (DUF1810 family)
LTIAAQATIYVGAWREEFQKGPARRSWLWFVERLQA